MSVNLEHVKPGEPIQVRKDGDGTVSVWFADKPLIQHASPAAAIAAIRQHFGTVDPRVIEYLNQ